MTYKEAGPTACPKEWRTPWSVLHLTPVLEM